MAMLCTMFRLLSARTCLCAHRSVGLPLTVRVAPGAGYLPRLGVGGSHGALRRAPRPLRPPTGRTAPPASPESVNPDH